MMPSPRSLILAGVTAVCVLLAAGCNDTLRQFIIQVPPPGGDQCTACGANAVVVSTNPASLNPATPTAPGSTLHIDVTGDSVVGVAQVGPNPVFLGGPPSRVFVINSDNTVTSYATSGLTPISIVGTATQPGTVSGSIAGGAGSSGTFYIANTATNNLSLVALIAGGTGVTGTVPVSPSTGPVAVAANSANNKIYVVNSGSNNVSVLSTVDNTIQTTIPVGSHPIWGVMATDGVHVFIVNQGDGTVSVIDTLLDKVICPTLFNTPATPCTSSFSVGTSASSQPNFAVYDPKLQRVYVSNTGENTISVIKANGIDLSKGAAGLPSVLANIPVSGTPVSVTALGDGTRAYAALGNCPAGTNHTNLVLPDVNSGNLASCNGNLVSVIDTTALRETKTIPVGPGAVSVDSAKDGSRVYVISAHDTTTIADNVHAPNCSGSSCLPGAVQPNRTFATPSVTIINTTTDTPLVTPIDPSVVSSPSPTFHVPQQDPNCKLAIDSNFNSKVPMPCPLQVPFQVKVFP